MQKARVDMLFIVHFHFTSSGFIWFFSFLFGLAKYKKKENLIILLDEPGLNLHAEAQFDLLKYIDKELLTRYQVVYTTHSRFMVESDKLDEIDTNLKMKRVCCLW